MQINKSVLQGLNVNKLRYGVARWVHSENLFPYYSTIPKRDLIAKILNLKDYREGDEETLEECILGEAYGVSIKHPRQPLCQSGPEA
jgi:hypothetical protein